MSTIDPFAALPTGSTYGLAQESGKLHLGLVLEMETAEPGLGRLALQQLPGMTAEAADSILDWLDDDNTPREFGAEADFYQQLNPPYQPRNGFPKSLHELRFVRGVPANALTDSHAGFNWSALSRISSMRSGSWQPKSAATTV